MAASKISAYTRSASEWTFPCVVLRSDEALGAARSTGDCSLGFKRSIMISDKRLSVDNYCVQYENRQHKLLTIMDRRHSWENFPPMSWTPCTVFRPRA